MFGIRITAITNRITATSANYNTVIWFTGAEYGGFAGPSPAQENLPGNVADQRRLFSSSARIIIMIEN